MAAFGIDECSGQRQSQRVVGVSRDYWGVALVADADADAAVEIFDIDGDVAVSVDEGVVEEHVEGLTNGAVAA